MDAADYLRKSGVSKNSKVEMKGTVLLVKINEMYNIFKRHEGET